MKRFLRLTTPVLLIGLALNLSLIPARAAEVRVAVASNFSAPMKVIAENFQKESGHRLSLAFGATGQFYAQIRNGAPFDVLLAADQETPRRIEAEGLAVPGSRMTYATGRLVLWSADPQRVDSQGDILRSARFEKLALANPKLAPYGKAAQEVLAHLNLAETLKSKRVEATNISQVFQFVASGNADIGFVALSQVLENGKIRQGSAWVVPQALHQPIRQDAVVLNNGKQNSAASALLGYLQTEKAKAVIRSFGYDI